MDPPWDGSVRPVRQQRVTHPWIGAWTRVWIRASMQAHHHQWRHQTDHFMPLARLHQRTKLQVSCLIIRKNELNCSTLWVLLCFSLPPPFFFLLVVAIFLVADVAVLATNNSLDEILISFYPHFIEELSKVVFKKTVSCNTPVKLDAIMFAQQTLVINAQEMRAFHTAYAVISARVSDRVFSKTTLLILYILRVKYQEFIQSLVAFCYSNICYCVSVITIDSRFVVVKNMFQANNFWS